MIRRSDNQRPKDETPRNKRARIESVERSNEEGENSIPGTQNILVEDPHGSPEATVEIVGERALDNASEDDDLSLFRALEEGSGNGHNTTSSDSRNIDRGISHNSDMETNGSATVLTNYHEEPHTVEVLSQTANSSSVSTVPEAVPSLAKAETNNKEQAVDLTEDAIDLDAEEQQVLVISDDDFQEEAKEDSKEYGAAKDYRCPICFEPPETALMTLCGHVFCCSCLFQMVNSSRTCRQFGHCALCRSKVYLKDVRLIILRKKQVKKKPI
ncbi:hypothetical protein SMKI_05G1990 [Saccharomyces mikatae IFO 1815]|uniref:RING-type domain-containing protein n=1 Tax=Saccharomyces mikatae IFO 1815 TaxID=226126 RepID=A0AA35IXZ6_SACMI|nr:uncharacterized protein SMKI_05G1990 [Saccharomyces mikatae IFO 1815]CAI4038588.1 hypothetical protein SMKI_05G1990 [Saccharomyces mikatae IFO 1815]